MELFAFSLAKGGVTACEMAAAMSRDYGRTLPVTAMEHNTSLMLRLTVAGSFGWAYGVRK